MLKLNDEWHICSIDYSNALYHTACKASSSYNEGFTRHIIHIIDNFAPSSNYCDSCNKLVPIEIINKVKFIYAKVK